MCNRANTALFVYLPFFGTPGSCISYRNEAMSLPTCFLAPCVIYSFGLIIFKRYLLKHGKQWYQNGQNLLIVCITIPNWSIFVRKCPMHWKNGYVQQLNLLRKCMNWRTFFNPYNWLADKNKYLHCMSSCKLWLRFYMLISLFLQSLSVGLDFAKNSLLILLTKSFYFTFGKGSQT